MEKTDKAFWLPKASTVISNPKVPGHQSTSPKKPFKVPEGYSYDALKRGYEATTSHHKPASFVNMAISPSRDNLMYERLDPEYIRLVKKERKKGKFELNDYLPNSLQMDKSNTSFHKNDSVGSGLTSKARYGSTVTKVAVNKNLRRGGGKDDSGKQ